MRTYICSHTRTHSETNEHWREQSVARESSVQRAAASGGAWKRSCGRMLLSKVILQAKEAQVQWVPVKNAAQGPL